MNNILSYVRSLELTKLVKEALVYYGIYEYPGNKDNPIILSWAKELKIYWYDHDAIAWCGLFIAYVVKRAGYKVVDNPLRALSWKDFGIGVPFPRFGDIVVFTRDGGGHVGIYIGESDDSYYILGGNQKDEVNISRLNKTRAVAFRSPPYKVTPQSVKKYFYTNQGVLSTNES